MDAIEVPAPPDSAYNPNRRVSDLLLGQLKHFQHVETKHGKLGIDPKLARNIYTEAGAAAYIAAVTRALGGKTLKSKSRKGPVAVKGGAKKVQAGLALAAAEEPAGEAAPSGGKAKKTGKRRS